MPKHEHRNSLERLMDEHDADSEAWPTKTEDNTTHLEAPLKRRQTALHHHLAPAVIYAVVLVVGCCLGFLCGRFVPSRHVREGNHAFLPKYPNESPAYAAIALMPFIVAPELHIGAQNPYSGAPNEESNAHWKSLLRGYNIRVHESWLSRDQAPSIALSDGSGDIWASLSLYHHLHCLDSIRHQLSGTGCVSKDSKLDQDGFPVHLDHCIETLRQWLICQPDLTLRSVFWSEDGLSASASNSITHQCVNWSALQNWVDDHTIPPGGLGLVDKPDGEPFEALQPPPPRCADI